MPTVIPQTLPGAPIVQVAVVAAESDAAAVLTAGAHGADHARTVAPGDRRCVRWAGSRGWDATGNLAGFAKLVMSSLLRLAGHGTIQLEDAQSWSSQHALVIGLGAFTGLLDYRQPVTVRVLEEAGVNLELANRLAVEIVTVAPPTERDMLVILREWPDLRSLTAVCARLGYDVHVHDEAIRRAARVVQLGYDRSTLRTAGGWLVSALRQGLIDALEQPDAQEIIVTPDSLPIPPNATRPQPRRKPPDFLGGDEGLIVR